MAILSSDSEEWIGQLLVTLQLSTSLESSQSASLLLRLLTAALLLVTKVLTWAPFFISPPQKSNPGTMYPTQRKRHKVENSGPFSHDGDSVMCLVPIVLLVTQSVPQSHMKTSTSNRSHRIQEAVRDVVMPGSQDGRSQSAALTPGGTSLIVTQLTAFSHLSAATKLARLSPLHSYRGEVKDKVPRLPLTQRSQLLLWTAVT